MHLIYDLKFEKSKSRVWEPPGVKTRGLPFFSTFGSPLSHRTGPEEWTLDWAFHASEASATAAVTDKASTSFVIAVSGAWPRSEGYTPKANSVDCVI